MPDLVSVMVGAIIGILAGPVTELVKHSLARRQDSEIRERDFQRETLLALARHLTDAHMASILVSHQHQKDGFPESFQDDNLIVFEENMIEVRHHAPFVADAQIRQLAEDALEAAGASMMANNEADREAKGDEAAKLFKTVADRIGEKVRSL